jgi:hypothetical protein
MYAMSATYNLHSAYITNSETLSGAIAKAQWARDFYDPMYPGTVRISVDTACERCEGHGRITKGRKNVRFPKYATCPSCNGMAWLPVPSVA